MKQGGVASTSNPDDSSQNIPAENTPPENIPSEDVPTPDVPSENDPSQDIPTEDNPLPNLPSEDNPTPDFPAEDDPSQDDSILDDPIFNEDEAFIDFDGVMLFTLERAVSAGVDYTVAVSPSGMHRLTINSALGGVIPDGFISSPEFSDYRDTISDIVIDSSITQIGRAAFSNLTHLNKVIVGPNGVPALQVIDAEAFAGCPILRSINLENCTSLTTIGGDTAAYKTSGAFAHSGLYSVTIPSSVTNIGAGAFYGCPSLQNVNFEYSTNDMTLGSHIFSRCTSLQSINLENLQGSIITVPAATTEYGESGSAMLSFCASLRSVVIPHGFGANGSSIENICFACINLENITFETNANITSTSQIQKFVNAETGSSNQGPENISVIDLRPLVNLQKIDSWSIRAHTKLLILPESITQFGSEIVSDCNILDIDFGENPQLAYMSERAFKDSRLSVIDLSKATALSGISVDAFSDCANLRKVILPERIAPDQDVVVINSGAFKNCAALEQVYCNAGKVNVNPSASEVFSGIDHEFEIVFGENTKTVTASLLKQLEGTKAKLKFNPGTIFSVEPSGDDSYSRMGLPFDDLGGDYFADASGNIYKIIAASPTEELELVYADKSNTGVCRIDERTTSIHSNAFSGCKYSSIEFVSADKITHIGEGAFANCRGLNRIFDSNGAEITNPYTVQQVNNFFVNANLSPADIDGLFANTSLRPEADDADSHFGGYIKDADNTMKLDLGTTEAELASFNINKKEMLTGETATVVIYAGNPLENYTYRMYARCSDGYDGDNLLLFGFKPLGYDGIYYRDITAKVGDTVSDNVNFTIKDAQAPGKLQFWAAAIPNSYIDGDSALLVYPVTDDKIGYDGATTTGEYFEMEWKVEPYRFDLSKTVNNSIVPKVIAYKINGETKKTITDFSYRISSAKTDTISGNIVKDGFGSDYVLSVDFTDTIELPENVSFRDDLFAALDTLSIEKTSDKIYLMVKLNGETRELASISNNTSAVISNIKVREVPGQSKMLNISWTASNSSVKNGMAVNEISGLDFYLGFSEGILIYTPDETVENEKIEINNSVDAHYNYSFSSSIDNSDTAPVFTITPGAAELEIEKKLISIPEYFGEKAKYQITVSNPSAYDFNGKIVLTDKLHVKNQAGEISQYITAENIEKMLKDDKLGANPVVTITGATLFEALTTDKKVTSVDGSTSLVLDSSNTCETRPHYNTCIDWTSEDLRDLENGTSDHMYAGTGLTESNPKKLTDNATITISNGENGGLLMVVEMDKAQSSSAESRISIDIPEGTSLRDALSSIEYNGKAYSYVVTPASLYTSEWTVENYSLAAGEKQVINLDADVKNTFQNLSSDWEQWYQFDKTFAELAIQNTAELKLNDAEEGMIVAAPTTTTSSLGETYSVRVMPDLLLKKRSTVNGVNSDGVETVCVNNDIIDYTTTINHRGTGTYETLPFVDNMFGPQALLIDPVKNPQMAGCSEYEVDGKSYYILNPARGTTKTYKNVWIDGRCADSVTVSKNENGLINTIIKWYFSDTPAYNFSYEFKYKAVVTMDDDVGQAVLGNFVWLNDNQEHRLYDKCFNVGVSVTHDKNIVTDMGVETSSDDDVLATERKSSISRDNTEVIYRLDLGHKGTALSLTKDSIFDALPNISDAYHWKIEDIDLMFVVNEGGIRIENSGGVELNKWLPASQFASVSGIAPSGDGKLNFAQGQQFIIWNDDFSIQFPKSFSNVYAYIYVKLRFSSAEDDYNRLFDKYGLQTLTNSFYLYNLPATVSHTFLEKGRVLLQKGVYEIGTGISKQHADWLPKYDMYVLGLNRKNISISSYSNNINQYPVQNLVTYYVTIKNCGKTKLYLPTIYDSMPPYIRYLKLISSPDELAPPCSKQNDSTFLAEGNAPFADPGGTFINAKITANVGKYAQHIIELTVEPDTDGKLQKETDGTYKGMYYLQPNEYIQFGIMAYVDDDAYYNEDVFTNNVIMEYVDYNGAGVDMVSKEENPVAVSEKNGLAPNDGDRKVVDDKEVNSMNSNMYRVIVKKSPDDLWLNSAVDVESGEVVPGINKTVSGDKTIYKSTDPVEWQIKAINNGESWLSDYTISDTIEYPYTFNGRFCYSMFAPADLREEPKDNGGYTWEPNEYLSAYNNGTSNYYLFDIKPDSVNKDQLIVTPAHSDNKPYSITINGDPVTMKVQAKTFNNGAMGGDAIKVSATRKGEKDPITLNIRFCDKIWALLPGGGYGILTVTTQNGNNGALPLIPGSDVKKTNFTNTAVIYPSEKENSLADYRRVTIGQKIADNTGNYIGVQSNAAISVYDTYPTTSVMEIEELDVSSNRGISTDLNGNTIFVDSTTKNVKYTLTVKSYNNLVMEDLVVINSLPDEDDTLMFSGQERKSDFKVSFLDNPVDPVVYVDGKLYKSGYIIEYSDCSGKDGDKFTTEDWQQAESSRWYSECKATSRSVRVRFIGKLPENAEVKILYDAKIEAEDGITNGDIAWNSFGYQYHPNIDLMTGDDKPQESLNRISAAPMVVGVGVPNKLILEKVIVNGTSVLENNEFNFVIYKGEAIVHDEFSQSAIGSSLTDRKFTCVTVSVKKGESSSSIVLNEVGKDIFEYKYNSDTKVMEETATAWIWESGKQYTIVEIDDNDFSNFGSFTDNADKPTYTFKYNPETEITITANNLYETGHGFTVVTVRKDWDDDNDRDGKRPESVTVKLLANGEETGETVTLNEGNGWTDSFANLAKYDEDDKPIQYTVKEVVPNNSPYISTITGANDSWTIKNKYTPEKTVVSGSKTWNDNNDQDKVRPTSITINLLADGVSVDSKTVTEADNWSWTFDNLKKYRDGGVEIKYTITEDKVEGYTSEINTYDVTNTHNPEKIEVSGSKTWNDNDNQDGARPTSIKINLFANGEYAESKTVTAADNWSWKFEDLDKYAGGNEIFYTITEDTVKGYTTDINTYDVTNTHTPAKVSLTVVKLWNDAEDQDGKRPDSIVVQLLADESEYGESVQLSADNNWTYYWPELDKFKNGVQIKYTIEELTNIEGYEKTSAVTYKDDGNTVSITLTNKHTPETTNISGVKTWIDNDNQDGKRPESVTIHLFANKVDTNKTAEATKENGWKYAFNNLPKYENGNEIVYTITEEKVDGYTANIDEFNITNTHTPETISISGIKTWVDNNNQDGKRPKSITINLLADGTKATSQTVTPNSEGKWEYTFENLPKYENGNEIVYTIEEVKVEGYESKIDGYNITNTHTPETINISGVKTWVDNDNQDGKRPDSVTIHLFANKVDTNKTAEATKENGWKYAFNNLPKYENGNEIVYTITEEKVDGYTTNIDKFNITNTHTPETINISGIKTWIDNDNQDGKRPESVTIHLFANKVDTNKTAEATKENGWKYAFNNLPKYENGNEIVYTITEEKVDGYTTDIDKFNITNTHTPETINISGVKTWVDNDNQDGKRPESVTIHLFANKVDTNKTAEATKENGWKYAFNNLPKYKNGNEIVYTITEEKVDGYTTNIDKFNITNTHIPETTEITVVKLWSDGNDLDGIRPSSVTVQLLANGSTYGDKVVLSNSNMWTTKWENLPKYENGVEVKYTVEEEQVFGYIASYTDIVSNTITITNTHNPMKYDYVSITGHKIWDDDDDIRGIRPDSITVDLLADGVVVRKATVTASNGWQWCFNNLERHRNGTPIVYTVCEEPVEGYISMVDGYNIINYYIPEPVEPDTPVEADLGNDRIDYSGNAADKCGMGITLSALLGTALAIGLSKIFAGKSND